jgi:hypothetical protein
MSKLFTPDKAGPFLFSLPALSRVTVNEPDNNT